MAQNDISYADVALDIPHLPVLTYLTGEHPLSRGHIVRVEVGKRRLTGIVTRVHQDDPGRAVKAVDFVFEDIGPMPSEWMTLVEFASKYYQHGFGEVGVSQLPPFLRKAPGPRVKSALASYRKVKEQDSQPPVTPPALNADQETALKAISNARGYRPFVLFGVTGSGKTEVYLRAIEALFARNPTAQVLMLVPEINLTPQLLGRVRARFPGKRVFSMHSGLSAGERMRAFLAMHESRGDVLVATRMGIFASLPNLQMVIVDEEHDLSYKADDGIRFHARDLAIARAYQAGCSVVLGSATPSLETWAHVKAGDYTLLPLPAKAVQPAAPATIQLVDPRAEPVSHGLAQSIIEAVDASLKRQEQVLIFINRRGYSPVLTCPVCGWLASCPHCSAHTVFHKMTMRQICHHCGFSEPVPDACPVCGNQDLQVLGLGTQRLEESLAKLWPAARVLRIDADTTRGKYGAQAAFEAVHAGQADIVVGTQMIAKGHDFKNVSTVVILNVDAQIASGIVRSEERAFMNMMQVSGRAGRAGLKADIYVQTRFGDKPLFEALSRQDYAAYADAALIEREEGQWPPYVFQALLVAQATTLDAAMRFLESARQTAFQIPEKEMLGIAVYDAVPMNLVRLKDKERAQLLIEGATRPALSAFLHIFKSRLDATGSGVSWHLDVDPLDI